MKKQYAQIIVDVPTMQTDQPYTYVIPEEMIDQILPGMRVTVPFGRRKVMGFVIGIRATTDLSEDQLRPLTTILDLSPVLNTELLSLSDYLADETFAFRISILQTMLPNALKADYQHFIKIVGKVSDDVANRLFMGLTEIAFHANQYSDKDLATLAKLRRQHSIEVRIEVNDRAKVKTQLAYQFSQNVTMLKTAQQSLRPTAKKQAQLMAFILQHVGETWLKKELQEMLPVSDATLAHAVTHEWLVKKHVEALRDPFKATVQKSNPLDLNDEQQQAFDRISASADLHRFAPFLLEGITGSGKTEVYLQVAQHVLKQGKTVLFLVPEIALTPQMVRRVKSRFGEQTAVLHSGLSDGERYDEWRRIERGDVQIVVGARSAVFAPLDNLGVIIVDEEHETTYKQSDNPRYNARDVALWRGEYYQIPVILGSATPSLETRARAQRGVYERLTLTQRAGGAKLPKVDVIDMKDTLADGPETNFSAELKDKIADRLNKKEQIVLMLNRRGFSSFVMCRDCGFVPRDPNCNLAMTLHMDSHTLKCHYCGHEEPIPTVCPNCGSKRIRYYGTGTEKVAVELAELFPTARVIRMDQDTTRKKGSMDKLLEKFGRHEADILLGTQMIAKGLDFPDVTLVGVLNADTALGLPDFHASERTFQLLTQVSGRAGRAQKSGEVVVQTFNPQHYAIVFAQQHDYEGFYHQEMRARHAGNYSPYYYTVQIQASHSDENQAALQMLQVARWLRAHVDQDVIVLGPSPKPIAKMRNRYYFQIILKFKQRDMVDNLLKTLQNRSQNSKGDLRLSIDREPVSFM
ncbi:primosomal protein N' [Leuconostoc pseudomesenteroides]|uniref:Replication restart protein PriA n=1 Tax=Leuconostoc pseudomesenteroides TaxID=33968 RepID=A0A5B8T4K7_LEUPS|nr:primosomal protein N' [Leuconostoc pseudomesenteroides]MCC8440309.1 primosomal protein N' [Leuconostoc pseudomesenteroides]MDG9733259.1 primosomal protein N' [Leuconostoc pseudomesenteroides]NKZ36592.1 primosomal protein N' [Leuconostoc pseudomesenteroides]QEA42815.1 primosomal protein N' [Leuconostoc pseudomesenteroides]QQB26934.1 primosomal protein N' [Leuconostoc pseudomesenteroides]